MYVCVCVCVCLCVRVKALSEAVWLSSGFHFPFSSLRRFLFPPSLSVAPLSIHLSTAMGGDSPVADFEAKVRQWQTERL